MFPIQAREVSCECAMYTFKYFRILVFLFGYCNINFNFYRTHVVILSQLLSMSHGEKSKQVNNINECSSEYSFAEACEKSHRTYCLVYKNRLQRCSRT